MKITTKRLKQLIKEELKKLAEAPSPMSSSDKDQPVSSGKENNKK